MSIPRTKKTTPARKRTERYAIASSPLYGLTSHGRLAEILRWAGTTGQLRAFCRRPENFKRYFDRSKPGKKERLIEAPEARVKDFQARLLDLLRRIELPEYLHSARPGRSYLSNSAAHCEADGCTITMDIDAYYQSTTRERVLYFFETHLKQPRDVADTLANLLCCDGHLATGSPVSPLVSFWAYREVFDAIEARIRARAGLFTLYIDDMAITGKGLGHTDIRWISRLLRDAGLTVKETKTRVFHAQAPKLVTGRASRNGVSRAPNKQHHKMRTTQALLEKNPDDASLRASVAGLKRHLALLDDTNRDRHREEAARLAKPLSR